MTSKYYFIKYMYQYSNKSLEYYAYFQYKPKPYTLHHILYTYLNIIFVYNII